MRKFMTHALADKLEYNLKMQSILHVPYRATQEIVEHSEFQKLSAERDGALIFLLMQQTFALRRKEIINPSQPIAELKERWLALFCEVQVSEKLMGSYRV